MAFKCCQAPKGGATRAKKIKPSGVGYVTSENYHSL